VEARGLDRGGENLGGVNTRRGSDVGGRVKPESTRRTRRVRESSKPRADEEGRDLGPERKRSYERHGGQGRREAAPLPARETL
jgi:hypothetical protein